jgi:hypothetical protein
MPLQHQTLHLRINVDPQPIAKAQTILLCAAAAQSQCRITSIASQFSAIASAGFSAC